MSPAPCRRSRRWSKAGCASIPSSGCGYTGAGAETGRLFSGLDPGPQAVHQPLRLRIMGADGVEPLHHGVVRIDGLVVENRAVDEFLAREIAVGIGDEVRIL